MMPRTLFLAVLLPALLPGCSPDSTGPGSDLPRTDIAAIHIARGSVPVDSVIHTGALGSMSFEVLLEDRSGNLHPATTTRIAWGSTHPSVLDESFGAGGQVFVFRRQNGRARLVAELGEFRDSVAVEIRQVAVAARVDVDTMVTLVPDARDLSGAFTAYHTFRFGAEAVDSNGYRVESAARIEHFPIGNASFDIFPTPRGDAVFVAGREAADGRLGIRFAGRTDTLPVQVAERYRVLRLHQSPSGTLFMEPAAVTIPRGTAIVFHNHSSLVATLGGEPSRQTHVWRAGPLKPGAFEAQVFRSPGVFEVWWAGHRCVITVT
jgi:hypothetical protein